MYFLISLIYWPIWLYFRYIGYEYTGMFIGTSVVVVGLAIAGRIQFKTWKFWK